MPTSRAHPFAGRRFVVVIDGAPATLAVRDWLFNLVMDGELPPSLLALDSAVAPVVWVQVGGRGRPLTADALESIVLDRAVAA
ncbi:MAG: hypothetical protein ACRDU8_02185 [Egibacteraceae bacterium]